jgi:hypothetical protein
MKGKKMAGNMGGQSFTKLACQILKIDNELNLIYIKDTVPGCLDAYVRIRDTVIGSDHFRFKNSETPPPSPTASKEQIKDMDPILLSKLMLE